MKKKVIGVIVTIVILLIVVGVGGSFLLPMLTEDVYNTNTAFVIPIAELNGTMTFSSNRYSGVVETQEVVSVKADNDKTIKETYVEAGDDVKKGDKLFEYDVEEMKIQLSQSELDLEQTQSEISSYNTQIESLEKEKKTATTNQQLSLTNQIEALKLDLKKANYTVETKTKEIEELNKSIENCVVKSTVDGKIQSVGSSDSYSSTSNAYITIASDGDYRIKALVSEENIYSLYEDASVIIRSRINDEQIWTGKITSIDTAAPDSSQSAYGTETTTKYPVYVELDSTDDLMVGQHVTIELDLGQMTIEEKSGLWLDEFYICDIDSAPYVWCDNGSGRLERRSVELGDYDEELMKYDIVSGLTEEDYIAFPEDRLTEGMATITELDDSYFDTYEAGEEEIVIDDGEYVDNGDGTVTIYNDDGEAVGGEVTID